MARLRMPVLILVLTLPLFAELSGAQLGQADSSQMPPLMRDKEGSLFPPRDPSFEAKRLKKLNELRQKSMEADADKLLRLARELNEAVAVDAPAMSAQERLRRIAEIEKLAKDVKNKMIFATGAAPDPYIGPMRIR